MSAMLDAMVNAGLVTHTDAHRVEKDRAINGVLDEKNKTGVRKRQLRTALKKLIRPGGAELTRDDVFRRLDELADEYRDVFDQISVEFAYDINLQRTR